MEENKSEQQRQQPSDADMPKQLAFEWKKLKPYNSKLAGKLPSFSTRKLQAEQTQLASNASETEMSED